MNIATEYLTRRKRKLFETPCSLILIGNQEDTIGKAAVVTFEDHSLKHYLVRRWNLYEASPEFILPPMKEFVVPENVIFSQRMISGFTPLPFVNSKIPHQENHYWKPMSNYVYLSYHDECLDRQAHRYHRTHFLWMMFINTYLPELGWSGSYPSQNEIKFNYPRFWKYWTKWKQYLLKYKGAAPELVFKT